MFGNAPLRPDPFCGPAPAPESLLTAFTLHPPLLAAFGLAIMAGAWQVRRSKAGSEGRALGVAALVGFIAFVSPLCALTVALFAARGVHHLVLVFALAPALAHLRPLRPGTGTPSLVALSAALWVWHVPAVYAAAWHHVPVYWGLQAALVLPAWSFWSGLVAPGRAGQGSLSSDLAAGLHLAALAGQMGLIGAILTFAPRPLYPEHFPTTMAFGLSPLADQQLAGLVMWVPGMVPVAIAAALLLRRAWAQVSLGQMKDGMTGAGAQE